MAAKKKTASAARTKQSRATQRERRQNIDVGPGMFQVSTAGYWFHAGHFANEDKALGAFKLAYL